MNPILLSPKIETDQPAGEQLRQMRSYLFQFKEQMEFLLMNIDGDNISAAYKDELSTKFADATSMSQILQSAGQIKLQVEELDGNVASLSLTTNGIYQQIYDPDAGILSELSVLGDSIAAAVKFGVSYTGFTLTPSKFHIFTTGALQIDAGNFQVDVDGNVKMKGRVEATEGKIGNTLGINSSGITYEGDPALTKDNLNRLLLGSTAHSTAVMGHPLLYLTNGNATILFQNSNIGVDGDVDFRDDVTIGGSLVQSTLTYNGTVVKWKDIDTVVGTGAYILCEE